MCIRDRLNPPIRNEIMNVEHEHEHEPIPFDAQSLLKENPNVNAEGDEEKQWPLNPWREERIRDYRKADDRRRNTRVRREEMNILVPVDLETFRKEQAAPIPELVRPQQNRNSLKCREKYKTHNAVSYTHLDVYKRQVLKNLIVSYT